MREPIQRYFQVGLVSAMAYAPQLKEGAAWTELVRRIAVDDYFQVVELNPLPDPETRAQVAALQKTVTAVCRYAWTKGIGVELEVFDHDIAKKALLGPAPLAARFAAQVRESCPNFGLMADLSHFPMTYETSAQVIPVLRPYLTHFHIGNTVCQDPAAEAYGDEHPRFGFPNSSNDVPQVLDFLRQLRANGFFCPERPYILTFEIKPWAAEDADIVIANAKRTLNRAWALLED